MRTNKQSSGKGPGHFQKDQQWCPTATDENHLVIRQFKDWVDLNSPDAVTRMVFGGLVNEVRDRNYSALFQKMATLEDSQCYQLCQNMKSLFDHLRINEIYLQWRYITE